MSYNKKCKWFSMEYVGNPGAVPACNQTGTLELFDCATCPENPVNKKVTKGDRLRQMTNEELAEWITTKGRTFGEEYEGFMSLLDWLKSPVEEEE